MLSVTDEQAHDYMRRLLAATIRAGASDLFIASDFPPCMKILSIGCTLPRSSPEKSRAGWPTP